MNITVFSKYTSDLIVMLMFEYIVHDDKFIHRVVKVKYLICEQINTVYRIYLFTTFFKVLYKVLH